MILPVETTVARVTLRQLFVRRRALAVLAMAAVPPLIALVHSFSDARPDAAEPFLLSIYRTVLVGVVLPVVALLLGTGAFGGEQDDGTILYLLCKPVARWRLVVTKLLVAGLATALVCVPSALLTGIVALGGMDDRGIVLGFTAGTAVGSLLYCAIFLALSLTTARSLVAGLAYVLVWEGLLAKYLGAMRLLSVREYVVSTADRVALLEPGVLQAGLEPSTAMWMALALLAACTLLSVHKLARWEVGKEA